MSFPAPKSRCLLPAGQSLIYSTLFKIILSRRFIFTWAIYKLCWSSNLQYPWLLIPVFLAVRRQPYKSWCPPQWEKGQNFKSILSLVIKRKVVQNVNRMSENNISVCQYVRMSICQHVSMSICQYVRMQLFSLVIKMKVVQNVKTISENIISVCQHVSMSICPYVNMSICQNATFQLRYQNENCSKCHQEKVVKKFERWETQETRDYPHAVFVKEKKISF